MTDTTTRPEDGLQADWPTKPAGAGPRRRSRLWFVHELPVLVLIAFALAILIKTFLLQAFYIPSESMEPTLHGCTGCAGDRVLVNKLAYRFREPSRGEVIVFIAEKDEQPRTFLQKVRSVLTEGLGVTTPPEKDFIKRIIGLPGDSIQVTDKGVFITPRRGKRFKLSEPYINDRNDQGPAQQPFLVPDDTFFVMGDNRGNSSDSRFRGPIKRSDIIGKAFVKIWPWRRWDSIEAPRYSRPGRGAAAPGAPMAPIVALAVLPVRRRAA